MNITLTYGEVDRVASGKGTSEVVHYAHYAGPPNQHGLRTIVFGLVGCPTIFRFALVRRRLKLQVQEVYYKRTTRWVDAQSGGTK